MTCLKAELPFLETSGNCNSASVAGKRRDRENIGEGGQPSFTPSSLPYLHLKTESLTQKAPFFHRWPLRVRYNRPAEKPPKTLHERDKEDEEEERATHTNTQAWVGGMRVNQRPRLPHEHEEEAGGGHQSTPAGGREHPQHGHDCKARRKGSSTASSLTPAGQFGSEPGTLPSTRLAFTEGGFLFLTLPEARLARH